jgi:hypothetical protein
MGKPTRGQWIHAPMPEGGNNGYKRGAEVPGLLVLPSATPLVFVNAIATVLLAGLSSFLGSEIRSLFRFYSTRGIEIFPT